jgi:hypothetical protein
MFTCGVPRLVTVMLNSGYEPYPWARVMFGPVPTANRNPKSPMRPEVVVLVLLDVVLLVLLVAVPTVVVDVVLVVVVMVDVLNIEVVLRAAVVIVVVLVTNRGTVWS